jgi:beta-lactamase regulating signal transducer with metallopeptidase domain
MQEILSNLPLLVKMSCEASVLIVLVLAAQWLSGPRLKPRWRCALWLLVLLRLALPCTVPCPTSLFNAFKVSAVSPDRYTESPVQPGNLLGSSESVPADSHPAPSMGIEYWLAWIWMAGALALGGYALQSQYNFSRRVRGLRPITDGPTLDLFEDCKVLMGVTTPVSLIEAGAVKSPALFGFVRPRLLLPEGLVSAFAREELRHVFLHELAHVRRRDIPVGWAALALQIIHWFNPLVWLAFYRLRADRELACDALALSCAQTGENESYGLTIVKLLEEFAQPIRSPGLAGILENKQRMKERIRMIAKFKKTEHGLALAVLLLSGLALVTLTDAQNQTQPQPATTGQPDASKGVWAVRFEPTGEFSPKTPGEFLARIHQYAACHSGEKGEIGYFRTTKQGGKLVGSFLAYDPDQLKAALSKVPDLNVTTVEKLTQEQLTQYENSPQESLIDFNHLDASMGIWAVRFEPVGNFSPKTPDEFLARIHIYSSQSGEIGFFRTTKRGHKLIGSFLAYDPDQLKAALSKVPGIKVTSVEKLDQKKLTDYENSPQESLIDFNNLDASTGIWAVRFEPVGDFAPKTPGEFLAKISVYSGQSGEIGYFRTTKHGDRLFGSFLAYDAGQLKAALEKIPELKVTSVEKLTQDQLVDYENSPQESF